MVSLHRGFLRALGLGFVLSATIIQTASAAGFYIQEQSVSGLGSAFAGSAAHARDASTIFTNPAGMTQLPRAQINGAVNMLMPSAQLTNTGSSVPTGAIGNDGGNPYHPEFVPNFFAAAPLSRYGDYAETLWVGVGVTAPFGLANRYDSTWFGRYDAVSTELTTLDIAPSIGWAPVGWLSVGGGIDIQRATADITSAAFVGAGTEGTSRLHGEDWSFGYNAGVQVKPWQGAVLGAHYRASIDHELKGQVSLTGSTVADFTADAKAAFKTPDVATFSAAQAVGDRLTLLGSATWFGWNDYEKIAPMRLDGVATAPVIQNYQTTWSFSAGADYKMNEAWTVRGGVQVDPTPTTDEYRSARTPDGDRLWLTAGATHEFSDFISIDMAAAYIHVGSETINLTRNSLAPSRVRADTEGKVGILSMALNFRF